MYYLIAQYYHPEHGVFLSLDPDPGDDDDILTQNGYTYANNNPVMLVDPDGHWVWLAINAGFAIYDGYKAYKSGADWKGITWAVGSNFIKIGYLKKASKLVKLTTKSSSKTKNVVYISKNNKGVVQYVGITNNYARRAAEHLRSKGIRIEVLMKNLTRSDARAVEQALIEIHGLQKNGGTLMNKINSISKKNPSYAKQLKRGYQLLKSIGYK